MLSDFRMPLVVGRAIAFFACCLYLCVELLPTGRRFLMLFCYFLFGIAASSSTILRAYIAAISTLQDRARAYSAIVVANMLSVVIGPICQLAFANMPYPGYRIIDDFLKFHIYSAPIWIASMTNFVSVAIIWLGLQEVHPHHKRSGESARRRREPLSSNEFMDTGQRCSVSDDDGMFTLEGIKQRLRVVRSLDLAWNLIVLCWIERIVANLSVVTLQSIVSPLVMISFGWDGQTTVKILAACMGLVGILAISVAAAFIVLKLGTIVPPRVCFLLAVMISIVMYVLSYPYDMTSHKMHPYNGRYQSLGPPSKKSLIVSDVSATTGVGCNPKEYNWCDTAYATYPWIFLPVICVVMGIGVPTSQIALDTIYSKILGSIDQSMMQGAIIVAEDIILILGPLYAASMFSHFGQGTLWLVNSLATIGGILLWLGFFPQLKPFK
ncbi:unnamed protein product [Heligmosomoides polygyrus]|uniref:Membrane transporter n=1 Tax=Heligmosomoides polygyrus TaxID=6339 RepID=A0A3P7Y5K6_HELPZ|nr:unnamed protein product [Heligmosomoides polygyrus]